jgi:hypothetical protein
VVVVLVVVVVVLVVVQQSINSHAASKLHGLKSTIPLETLALHLHMQFLGTFERGIPLLSVL